MISSGRNRHIAFVVFKFFYGIFQRADIQEVFIGIQDVVGGTTDVVLEIGSVYVQKHFNGLQIFLHIFVVIQKSKGFFNSPDVFLRSFFPDSVRHIFI